MSHDIGVKIDVDFGGAEDCRIEHGSKTTLSMEVVTGEGVGVIAQEVKELIPSAVRENEDGYLSVDYLKLIPYLIEEVKSLNNRIKTLESK